MESPLEGKVHGLRGKSANSAELPPQDLQPTNENQENAREESPIQIDLDNIPQTLKDLGELLEYWRGEREGTSPSQAERALHRLINRVKTYQKLFDAGESDEKLDAAFRKAQTTADAYTQQVVGDTTEAGFNDDNMARGSEGPRNPSRGRRRGPAGDWTRNVPPFGESDMEPMGDPIIEQMVNEAAQRAPQAAKEEAAEIRSTTSKKGARSKPAKKRTGAKESDATRHADQKNKQGDESISAQTGDHSPVNIHVDRSVRVNGIPLTPQIDTPVNWMKGDTFQTSNTPFTQPPGPTFSITPESSPFTATPDTPPTPAPTEPTTPVAPAVETTPALQKLSVEMTGADLGLPLKPTAKKERKGVNVSVSKDGTIGSASVHLGDMPMGGAAPNVSFTYTPSEPLPGGEVISAFGSPDTTNTPPSTPAPAVEKSVGPRTGVQLIAETYKTPEAQDSLKKYAGAREGVAQEESVLRRLGKGILNSLAFQGNTELRAARKNLETTEKSYLDFFAEKNQEAFEKDRARIQATYAQAEAIFNRSAKTEKDREKFESRKNKIGALETRSRGQLAKLTALENQKVISDERLRLTQERFANTPKIKKALMNALAFYGKVPLTGRIAIGAGIAAGAALTLTGVPVLLAASASLGATGASTLTGWVSSKWAERAQKKRGTKAEKQTADTLKALSDKEKAGTLSTIEDTKQVLELALKHDTKNEYALRREKRVKIILQAAVAAGTAAFIANIPKFTPDASALPPTVPESSVPTPPNGAPPQVSGVSPHFPDDPGYAPPPPEAPATPSFPDDPGYDPHEPPQPTPSPVTPAFPDDPGYAPPPPEAVTPPQPAEVIPVPSRVPGIFGQEYVVKPGDNTWNIIGRKLQEAGEFNGLSQAQKNALIQGYEDQLSKLGPERLKELGFKSGNLGLIHPNDKLDLSVLDQNKINPEPSLANKPSTVVTEPHTSVATQPAAPTQSVAYAGDVSPTAPPPSPAQVRAEVASMAQETLGRKGIFNFLDRIGSSDPAFDRFYKYVNDQSPALFLNLRPGATVFGLDPNDVLKLRAIITEAQHYNINVRAIPKMGQIFEEVAKARLGQRP